MVTKDLTHSIKVTKALAAVSKTATFSTDIIDTAGYESLMFVMNLGTGALDGSNYWTVKLEQGNDSGLSDATDVDAADLIGAVGSDADMKLNASANDSSKCHKVGYKGGKRYVKLTATLTGTMTQVIAVDAIQGHARKAPVA